MKEASGLDRLLASRKLIVGDGAMGTQLMARGWRPGECAELWNIEKPGVVEEIQREYAEAGADYLLTNTFGGNQIALERHGAADSADEVNRAAVEIARRAGGPGTLVIGDLGPTGRLLEPYGDLAEGQARAAYARQAAALAEAGADALMCETFESAAEMRIVLEAAREACALPLIASMKFTRETSGRYRTMMGEGPEALVDAARRNGCAALGSNCGQGIETMVQLARDLAAMTDLPIVCQPNAGMPRLVEGRTVYSEDPPVFARLVPELYAAGARIIGGCCGTTPDHVRVIRAFADRL